MSNHKQDAELEQYRSLLDTPSSYEDGFGWSTVAGIFFCGLVMMPGSIYLGLMTGGNINQAAIWVTVILFSEVMRRSMKTMTKGNLVVLLHAAHVMMAGSVIFPGGPFGAVIYRAYLSISDAARDMGMIGAFPTWLVPAPDSPAITERDLFHSDWHIPIALALFIIVVSVIKKYTLGYFFFRLCSDVEKLPFPLAPIQAQGALALAESDQKSEELDENESVDKEGKKSYSKWRVFTLGTVLGLAFGALQVGIPTISGLFLETPIFLIPQPFVDTTTLTEGLLPATPTGMVIDLGIILLGFVLPFWSVIGTFAAILVTLIMNPILQNYGILAQWQPGMDTVNTTFVNGLDFWMSFGFGTTAGIAFISIFSTIRDLTKSRPKAETTADEKDEQKGSIWKTPDIGRGDYPMWLALFIYTIVSIIMVVLCNELVPDILGFLIFFAFIYIPFISYLNARLLGIAGQNVEIPFVREGAFILSGCKTLDIWLAPVPIENYGMQAQSFRVNELTGVSFRSLIKADLVALPILFALSFMFWAFIWKSGSVPSDIYPAAQINWELEAKRQTLMFSSTFVPEGEAAESRTFADSEFAKALHTDVIAWGTGITLVLYILFSAFGLPVMLIYGMIRGFGQFPHVMILEIVGALLGRYYYQKKFGSSNFLRMAPAIMAGYFTGVGLIGMCSVAMNLIKNAVSSAPF